MSGTHADIEGLAYLQEMNKVIWYCTYSELHVASLARVFIYLLMLYSTSAEGL